MSSPVRFLLVDDNPQDRALVARELRKEYPNATIREIVDQDQLESALATGEFDVTITDYHLHWSDGLRVLEAVKARCPCCPVIMFTGTGSEEIAVAAIQAGLDDYIIKNVSHLHRLCTAVRAVLAHAASRRKTESLEKELRERDSELAHLSRLSVMGEMVAGIAHEINQPLNAIANYTTGGLIRLERNDPDVQAISDTFRQISQQVELAADIIRKFRQLAVKQKPSQSTLDINDLLRECVDLFAFETRRSDTRVLTELAEGTPRVSADRTQIIQVILNLMRNSLEAMDQVEGADRVIGITTTVGNDAVEISVSDRGCGIPAEGYRRLLDPFVTTKPDGMGMGLAVSSRIVRAHGGELWATSNAECGAAFHFTLPLSRQQEGS